MIAELERRARAFDESTVLEYVEDWVGSGKTLTDLAESVTTKIKVDVTRHMVSKYVNALPGGKQMLEGARKEGGHGLADSGIQIVDDAAETGDRDVIAGAKSQADFRLRLAGFWNREYAPQRDQVNVNLNMGALHLDALRQKQVAARTHHIPISDGTPDVEVVNEG